MAAVKHSMEWLGQLKAAQLHQLAVALGCACSGSKAIVADGIREALTSTTSQPPFNRAAPKPGKKYRQLSIVSIDMGIQNLAYAHLLVEPQPRNRTSKTNAEDSDDLQLPTLRAWERLNVFPTPTAQDESVLRKSAKLPAPPPAATAYSPSRYADAAYGFITHMLARCEPTHILIERQRFRSGGGSAVAEWTLRVGVFEGMLHAILHTLREERKQQQQQCRLEDVVSIDPARSARFWLEGGGGGGEREGRKMSGREGKQAKIDLLAKSFLHLEGLDSSSSSSSSSMLEPGSAQVKAMQRAFLHRWAATSKAGKALRTEGKIFPALLLTCGEGAAATPPSIQPQKLDDLADCLLQALAWLRWRRMRDLVIRDCEGGGGDALAAVRRRLV
jgi:cruciform cutting endonuclease 1